MDVSAISATREVVEVEWAVRPTTGGGWVSVDPDSLRPVQESVAGWHAAHGAFDPSTGRPTRNEIESVSAMAPTAWQAEVIATTLMVSGPGVFDHLVRDLGASEAGARVTYRDGHVQRLGCWPRALAAGSRTHKLRLGA